MPKTIELELTREEALACVIALEREKKPYHWQECALDKFLRIMGLRKKGE